MAEKDADLAARLLSSLCQKIENSRRIWLYFDNELLSWWQNHKQEDVERKHLETREGR